MSRIGNKPVALPSGVEVIVAENNLVTVKGPKGNFLVHLMQICKLQLKETN